MKRFFVPSILTVFVIFLASSCILDPKKELSDGGKKGGTYKSLLEKDDVLHNLELCYNERNFTQYDKLLDDGFIFLFTQEDYSSGKTPDQWDRLQDITATQHLFDRNYSGKEDPVRTISLTLTYTPGDLSWVETTPPQGQGYDNETWFQKTANYDLTITTTTDVTYFALESQALFQIRRAFVASANDTLWRIVRWSDLGVQ